VSYSFYLLHRCDFLALFQVGHIEIETVSDKLLNVNELFISAETTNLLHIVDIPHKQISQRTDLDNVLAILILNPFDILQLRPTDFINE
jgi:hypothetical protein